MNGKRQSDENITNILASIRGIEVELKNINANIMVFSEWKDYHEREVHKHTNNVLESHSSKINKIIGGVSIITGSSVVAWLLTKFR